MIPETFGKYLLLEHLDIGGMGEVLLAKAQGESTFAITRIPAAGREQDDLVNTLCREAKLAVLLVHPNIAQLLEFGRIGDYFFLAMEHNDGVCLTKILKAAAITRGLLKPADAVAIAIQCCRALEYAHDKRDTNGAHLGIVHLGVSPKSIIVCENGFVKLIDFGLARALSTTPGTSTERSTPGYMSPEQGRRHGIDRRSDIYALGLVLYEALTLERIPNDLDLSQLDNLLKSRTPELLRQVLLRALAQNPEDRYATAGEMERDLSRAQSQIDPAHIPQDLVRLVREADGDRDARLKRLQSYARLDAVSLAGRSATQTDTGRSTRKRQHLRNLALAIALALLLVGGTAIATWLALQPPSPF